MGQDDLWTPWRPGRYQAAAAATIAGRRVVFGPDTTKERLQVTVPVRPSGGFLLAKPRRVKLAPTTIVPPGHPGGRPHAGRAGDVRPEKVLFARSYRQGSAPRSSRGRFAKPKRALNASLGQFRSGIPSLASPAAPIPAAGVRGRVPWPPSAWRRESRPGKSG